jgi:hypothetical protein
MNCADFEVIFCDYLDGTLDAVRRAEVEEHQRVCPACAEFARDVTGAVNFMEMVEAPEPPPELLTRIAFEIPADGAKKGWRASLFGWMQPALQPRFAMGMAMTILSFSMLARFAGIEVRQLRPADLQPAAIWSALDNRIHLSWERGVKYYENLRLVYEVQARLQEWTRQEEEERKGRPNEDRTAPAKEQRKGTE